MNTEELNALKERAYKTAVAHGFHEEEKPDAYWLGLVMSEMGEAINADQRGLHADTKRFEEVMAMRCITPRVVFEENIKDSVEDEIADIVIRLLDFAGMKGYDLLITSIDYIAPPPKVFEKSKLPGFLFDLIWSLSEAYDQDVLDEFVSKIIVALSDCFNIMTGGSDCDLWWFVKQKMRYNEQRPILNGKKY